jgi:hypothetical protein
MRPNLVVAPRAAPPRAGSTVTVAPAGSLPDG